MYFDIISHMLPIMFEQLKREYKKSPVKTTSTIILFSLAIGTAAFFSIQKNLEKQRKIQLIEQKAPSFQSQIEGLNEVAKSIENLSMFINKQKLVVQQQKEESIKQELALKELTERKEELEPLVSKYETVIKQWVALEKKEQKWDWWFNMGISFLLGIFASITANFISKGIDNYRTSKHIEEK